MRGSLRTLLMVVLATYLADVWADPSQRVPVQQSAFDVPQTPRWYVGAEGLWEGRDLFIGKDSFEFEAWHADAILGFQPFGWMILQAGIGATEFKLDEVESDMGIDWLVRVRANIAEYVFTTKPGVGRHQVVRFCASASYRDAEANLDDSIDARYFKWEEWLIEPYLQYTVNRLAGGNHDPLDVAAVAFRAGPAFSWINGRFDFDDIDEKRTYGVAVGGDVLLASGLTLGVEARTYGNGDGTVGASLGHRF